MPNETQPEEALCAPFTEQPATEAPAAETPTATESAAAEFAPTESCVVESCLPPPPPPPPPPSSPAPLVLRAISLSKSFRSPGTATPATPTTSAAPHAPERLQVLHEVSLEIREGELLSICGASGSGKTTLLQILGGLDRPDSGELHWNGERVTGRGNAFLARRRALWLGYVFQSYHLVPELDALENVVLAGRIAGRPAREVEPRARQLLESVGLSQRLRHHPAKLSGGECQRVAIARALINNPRLILADEPTGNLDETTGEKIMELLLHLTTTQGVALVLVTHNPLFALRAPRRLLLSRGTLTPQP